MKTRYRAFSVLVAGVATGATYADNAALTSGGMPSIMSAHPTVSMASEVVKVVIHPDRVDTDCTFVFKNEGPSCSVNMGFPDFGMWAYGEGRADGNSFFKHFQSYVDGKAVRTKLIVGKGNGEQWQTKIVPFDKNGIRIVREVYTTETGGIDDEYRSGAIIGAASYILHTGGSWHKPIGSAKVMFTFGADAEISAPIDVLYTEPNHVLNPPLNNFKRPDFVLVSAPMKPTVNSLTLSFEKTDWRPAKADDILLLFRLSPTFVAKERALAHQVRKGKH